MQYVGIEFNMYRQSCITKKSYRNDLADLSNFFFSEIFLNLCKNAAVAVTKGNRKKKS